nr:bifunctional 3-deoxy-7-phosphoheptulonate synthase/chorismate mutase type II [Nonlabens ulvanivorans]
MEITRENRKWLDDLQLSHPLVIAGPCSAETEEQVLETAHALKDSDVTMLRAGVWKPRTRPGSFEGVGAIALPWLMRAKKETGLQIAIEVGSAMHVKIALQYDIDVLWLGARTTVNPFLVQEIAEALNGTDKVVLVKNPVNPDLSLWLGAVERLQAQGIKNLGVIHRGFSTYRKTDYRNNPQWQIPIDLKSMHPDLPLICDPSHITGNREMIFDVCQTALDLRFDGLMVETHPTPDQAWSDAAQQITPATMIQIMEDLRIRKKDFSDASVTENLEHIRTDINNLDTKIIGLLSQRMKLAEDIGTLKKKDNVSILQSEIWKRTLAQMKDQGANGGLSDSFIDAFYKAIHQESIHHQQKMFEE